ncbi:MAG: glycoside hydrolase family 127 protein [Abitibacteriaceae bacterium]|nr:glycoside hydrolase family 127 protein [Abditibacteriaceae bacterium]
MHITKILLMAGLTVSALMMQADAVETKFHPLTPMPGQAVTIDDKFWSPKLAVWQQTTINDCFDKFEKTGALDNFDRVRDRQTGGHHGDPWWDGLVYEMITASAEFLAMHPDPALAKRVDGYVERIAAAAAVDPDGYINTDVTLNHVGIKWSDPPAPNDVHDDIFPHTLYNAGCLVEAGVQLYRATGQTKLLQVAVKMANYMCRIMGPAPKQNIVPGHALAEQAFVNLYLLFREQPTLKQQIREPVDEKQYLQLAEFWIENRGNHQGRKDTGVYNQDDKPVLQQATLEGHAVRSGLLAAGLVKAATVNGRLDYLQTAERWWQNMVEAKMYITGGLGAIPSFEGFGADYDLPNNGYAETCAAVAGGFFSQNLNLATGQATYADTLERILYNGALSGVAVAGNSYFYQNVLSSGPNSRRWDWHGCPCCPPMFLKMMGALPTAIYATDDKGVYVNLYIGSRAQIDTDKLHLSLTQTSNYPWKGDIRFTLTPRRATRFGINLRWPGWTQNATVAVNGHATVPTTVNGYIHLERRWKAGDVIDLHLPMPTQRVKADPRVTADVGRVALMRGPLVYCVEGLDSGGHIKPLVLPSTSNLTPEYQPHLLGGVTVLEGEAQVVHQGSSSLALNAPNSTLHLEPVKFTAIPFYANTNREPTEMEVWLADDVSQAQPLTPTSDAVASASHCFSNDTVAALNDAVVPKASDDESIPRMTWWDHRGTAEWVQYDFKTPRPISGVEVYWWDERRVNRQCRVPQSWTVQYLDDGQWKPVTGASPYGTQMDAFNRVTFNPVTTTALRLVVQLQPEWSAGILEWRVF